MGVNLVATKQSGERGRVALEVTDLLECQEGQFSGMKCLQETSDTEKSPEVNIEEFPWIGSLSSHWNENVP